MEDQPYNPVPHFTDEPSVPDLSGKTQVLGLDYKTAGILCYLPIFAVNLIASLIVLNSEPRDNRFLRFHAMQSLVMMVIYMVAFLACFTVSLIFGALPLIGGLIAGLFSLVNFVLGIVFIWQSVVGLIAASKGEMKHLPYVGQIAEERLAQ